MNGFSSIFGQDRAVELLRRALARETVHHAYFFEGPDGVGKRAAAHAFAQACNCERRPGEGCGACEPCRKIDDDLHPDVKWFPVLEDGKQKGQTDRVRELIPQLGFPPHEGRRRVVILEPADELNETASNVILKTLEEPPPRTHFVLVSARPASMLVTIRSRCQRVSFRELPDDVVLQQLVEVQGIDKATAESAAALAQGSLGRALALASSEEFPRRRAAARKLLEAARSRKLSAALEAAASVGGDREEAAALLELLWITYRDGLLVAGGVSEGRVSGARRDDAEWLAAGVGTPGLLQGLHAVEAATEAIAPPRPKRRGRSSGNVSPQLAFEALLLGLGQRRAV